MKEDLGKDRRSGNDRRVKDQPFMTERRYTDRRRVVSSFERDMLLSDSPVKTDEFTLLGVLADIRQKTGVGDKVMLGELADVLAGMVKPATEVESLKAALEDSQQTYGYIMGKLITINSMAGHGLPAIFYELQKISLACERGMKVTYNASVNKITAETNEPYNKPRTVLDQWLNPDEGAL